MRNIAIDINPILKNKFTGIGVYTLNLARELCLLMAPEFQFCLTGNRNLVHHLEQYKNEIPSEYIDPGNFCKFPPGWEIGRYAHFLVDALVYKHFRSQKVDLFHGTSYLLPALPKRIKQVVTVYDLAFLHLPGTEDIYTTERLASLTLDACRKADRVIAISQATKKDIMEFFHIDENKISVIYMGVDHERFGRKEEGFNKEEFLRKNHLPERYALFVGAIRRRKNLLTLVKALLAMRNQGVHLVIVGKPGNQHEEITRLVKEKGMTEKVHFLGHCSDEVLRGVYKSASVFVFPSLYEGFGLPVLEAMGCGIPVVTSDNSSLSELFHSAALLVDSKNEHEIARAIDKIVEEPSFGNELAEKGLRLSKEFSWSKMAQDTSSLYKEVLGKEEI